MKRQPSATVSSDLVVQLIVPGEGAIPLVVTLRYDAFEPYAIHATFLTGEVVSWVFARDLVSAGIEAPAGEGDVRLWPAAGAEEPVVYLALTSPDGQALFEAPAIPLIEFIRETERLVPPGTEGSYLDLDAALEEILRSQA
jgi:hypothetical protein